ncbi:hypothetical protein P7C71_g735, partial [Lecanoromycetidae sp. Uapishka_2]
MAALHAALKSLGPTPFSSVPTSQSEATIYLQQAFSDAQTIIESVPLPPPNDPLVSGRPRSSTSASIASNVSEISSSSARSELLNPAHESLQKEWGKPIKLNAKDNPLDCPPRDGFIRGNYESVEFIREIPMRPTKSSSTTDLLNKGIRRDGSSSLEKEALLRKAEEVVKGSSETLPNGDTMSPAIAENIVQETRKRGKTISFAESRGSTAKGEAMDNSNAEDEVERNPVEWIMITRSDPGGSVPRFMVERGTPSSIVADASKFLDWACKKEHTEGENEALANGDAEHNEQKKRQELEAYETNGCLAGVDSIADETDTPPAVKPRSGSLDLASPADFQQRHQQPQPGGLFSTVASAAYSGIESYGPQVIIDRLPGHQQLPSMDGSMASVDEVGGLPKDAAPATPSVSIASESSVDSFASAEDHLDDGLSTKSITSPTKSIDSKNISQHDKELAKLNDRKRQLSEKLAKAREKETKDKEELTSKEEERVRKMEEKHAKEVTKQEERYKKEIAKLEAKKQKEGAKLEAQKKKDLDKDEKVRLTRERDQVKQELEVLSKERDILMDQVGALQRENTSLVTRLGKMEEGKHALKEIKAELESNRSRSSSLRMEKGPSEKGHEATIIGGEKKELLEALK